MAAPSVEEGSLADNLAAALESGAGADVTLVVGDSELPAHGSVLAARSPVFAAALRHDMREARSCRIEIADVREAVLKQLLRFLYTDMAPELDSMAAELLSAADKYDVPLLKKRCELAMARQLTVDNAAATVVFSELHSCPLLKSAAVDFIVGHPQVMATEGWKSALRNNVDVAAEICQTLMAAASSKDRVVSKEDNGNLSQSLVEAASNGNVQEVRRLLAAGAPVDARDGSGYTALHRAVMNGHSEAVKCLVDAGADVNVQNSSQQTPLHYASYRHDLKVMWLLLWASAHVDVQDDKGQTPLHWAVNSHNVQAVKALLAAGADTWITDVNENRPQALAQSSHMRDIFKAF